MGIVNRQDECCKFRLVGADVEVLDADMNIVASKVVVDEQGKISGFSGTTSYPTYIKEKHLLTFDFPLYFHHLLLMIS